MAKKKQVSTTAKSKMRYTAENTKQIKFNFNLKYDADILEHLSNQANKQGYIKNLIREDIAKQKREQ